MSPSCSSSSSSLRPVPGSAAVLVALRQRMEAQGLDALVIPSEDAHQSEYVSLKDRRREFMCGFTGSAGTAVVTPDQALLWTDGRYFLQAKQQLGPEWDLMKALEEGVPTVEVWLAKHLHETKGGGVVGVNGLLLNMAQARSWKLAFDPRNVSLKILDVDLVDEVWGAAQPPAPDAPVRVHPLIYAGQDVPAKLENLRKRLLEKSASALLLSALDEVAWLYNIRGSDIQYNPVVYAYSVVTDQEAVLFIDGEKLGEDVKEHLATAGVTVLPYTAITTYLKESLLPSLQAQEDTPPPPPPPPQQQQAQATTRKKKVVMMDPNQVSLALGSLIPTECIIEGPSPITLAKAIKNHAELRGMRQAHIRDGVALTSFLAWLEKAMEGGKEAPAEVRGGLSWPLTEASIAKKLEDFRRKQEMFVSPSFATISAVGSNGAIIHYKPDDSTSAALIGSEERKGGKGGKEGVSDVLLLLDSGAQYLDGTTDVTRTVHFGNPTPEEKEAFTLVLRGHIALARARFPEGILGAKLDILARLPLWSVGLDYRHGTGHGVGAFLNVHEGPQSISYKKRAYEEGLTPGMVTSNEPGYYSDGRFGIRIESLLVCNEAPTKHRFGMIRYCSFETITMVPIQLKMIEPSLMTADDTVWLNEYHAQVRASLLPLLKEDKVATAYLLRETEPM